MDSKTLYDYYNESTEHDHLNCTPEVVDSFLKDYPEIQSESLGHADMFLYNYLYEMFFL